jgi:nucleoside-diphosphate-sugar epimerase
VRLFVFGLGYSARRIVRLPAIEASGTVRSAEAAEALRGEGIEAFVFHGVQAGAGLTTALARAQAILISVPPGPSGDPVLRTFAREISAAPDLERILYLSTIGVYGDWGGAWIDETSETRTTSARGRWRLAAEAQWRALGATRGVAVDILRLAGIYGPGRNALAKLREGDARRLVKPEQVFNRVHVEDIAEVVRPLLRAEGRGGVWNVADEEPAPPQDVIAFAAELLGLDPPPEEPFEGAAMSEMSRSFYEDNRRIRIDKLKRELGFRPLYPTYREGLRALARAGEGRARESRK